MLENANIFRSKDTQSPVIPTTNITVPAIRTTNITVPAITAGGHSINTETQSKKVAGGYTIIDFCINLRRFFSGRRHVRKIFRDSHCLPYVTNKTIES